MASGCSCSSLSSTDSTETSSSGCLTEPSGMIRSITSNLCRRCTSGLGGV